MVNLLMFQPRNDLEVARAVHGVAPYALEPLEFIEPTIHQVSSIVIVWVEKAREHSRGRSSTPLIVGYCPELDEQ